MIDKHHSLQHPQKKYAVTNFRRWTRQDIARINKTIARVVEITDTLHNQRITQPHPTRLLEYDKQLHQLQAVAGLLGTRIAELQAVVATKITERQQGG